MQITALKNIISIKSLRKAVESLPAGLNATYKCSFERVETQNEEMASLARKAILWLTYANRSLKMEELQDALAVSDGTEGFDDDDISPAKLIISVCHGLIMVDEESETVRLVREYITSCEEC